MMLVYETERFSRQAEELGVTEKVTNLRTQIEGALTVAGVRQYFDALVPYYKDRSGKVRIVGRMYRIAGRDVFCFLAAFERKSRDYTDFLWDRRLYGAKYLDSQVDARSLEDWVRGQSNATGVPISQTQPLPDELWAWLEPPHEALAALPGGDDIQIYESRRWVQDIAGRRFQESLLRFYDLLKDAVQNQGVERATSKHGTVEISNREGSSILVRRFGVRPQSLFLVAPFLGTTTAAQLDEAVSASKLAAGDNMLVEDIARRSRRTYPSYLLADEQAWRAIENDAAANLALSGEEENLLQSVANGAPGFGLPLFINGRAGSGKSTMLSYLFSAFCVRRQRNGLAGRPLFLTYNDRLLSYSRDGVRSLLNASHALVGNEPVATAADLESWFSPFRDYLLSRLPIDKRSDFPGDKHIAFHHFRNAYLGNGGRLPKLQLVERRKWSPELSWYVIRTFIKGYAAAGYLDPDLYSELPKAERVVSEDAFKAIYHSIWERWYQKAKADTGIWDDQDLVLAVLTGGAPETGEPIMAVVCDEAQDFTRRELQLVIRSLHLTDYDLSLQQVASLPLVLAGDPLQTLNPTGFRWESIRAALHEELAVMLGEDRVIVRLEQLENNYRSTSPIVEAVNGIQLWRSVLFAIDELKPQISWDVAAGSKPHKYIIGSNITYEELAKLVEDTIIIVPCDEGGEVDYVGNDPLLSRMFPDASDSNPPRNILSAPSAKGCEFGRVIVWCFGDACPAGLFDGAADDEQTRFEAEYFLNKLYVAASRPKHHLFVVDTVTGDAQLWTHGETLALDAFASRSSTPRLWREGRTTTDEFATEAEPSRTYRAIEFAPLGASSELKETAIEETAVVLRDQGVAARDPRLLRQAADFYRRVPAETEATRCEAWARRYEEQAAEAGRLFAQIGDRRESFECFWDALSWADLREWYRNGGQDSAAFEDRRGLVEFMTGSRSAKDVVDFTTQLSFLILQNRLGSFLEAGWREGIAAFLNRADQLLAMIPTEEAATFGEVLIKLGDRRFDNALKIAGQAFYRAGSLDRAVECWQRAGHVRHFEYAVAKATSTGLPQGLEWLVRDEGEQGVSEALRLWRKQGSPTDPGWLRHIARALERRGDIKDAFEAYKAIGDTPGQVRMFPALVKASVGLARRSFETLVQELAERRDLAEIDELLGVGRKFEKERSRAALAAVTRIVRSVMSDDWHVPFGKTEQDHMRRILEVATGDMNWRRHFHPLVLGAGFELAGNHVNALKFYEQLTNDSDLAVREAARRRWLKVKADHMGEANMGTKGKERARRERARMAQDWGFREDVELEAHPLLPPVYFSREVPEPESRSVSKETIHGVEIDQRGNELILLDFEASQLIRIDLLTGAGSTAEGAIASEDGIVRLCLPSDRTIEVRLGDRVIRISRGGDAIETGLV